MIYEAKKVLKSKGIEARIISMPSWEIFEDFGLTVNNIVEKALRLVRINTRNF